MLFFLATTFTRALRKLDKQSQEIAKRAVLDFQLDPSQSGFKFHRVENARDRHMWSFRANRDLRVIVHHEGDRFILCHVDHHDPAYHWATSHRIEQHPVTGQTQILEVLEQTEVITRQVFDDQTITLPPLAQTPAALLLGLGFPPDWIDWARTAHEDALLEHIEQLPHDVQQRLIDLLTGGSVEAPAPMPQADDPPPQAPSREIVPIHSPSDLERALASPWEEWLTFLHPEQRALIERDFGGAARIYGSAGTGKTIVALHRVAYLARQNPQARILLTTYTRALKDNLERRFELLVGEDAPEQEHLIITNFHRWLTEWYRHHFGTSPQIVNDADVIPLLREGLEAHPQPGFDLDYLRSEWSAIIEPYQINSRQEYFDIPRVGRGRALGKRQKSGLWEVFAYALDALQGKRKITWRTLSSLCLKHFQAHPSERPFDHIIVDEAQDFAPIELECLRALVKPGTNDLLVCSDAGQRLYGRAFSWLASGIDVRGRSWQLKVNYRTTEQIRAACEALLPEKVQGPDGEEESREAVSLRRGDVVSLVGCQTDQAQIEALSRWIESQLEDGLICASQIAIIARTSSLATRIASAAARRLNIAWTSIQGSLSADEAIVVDTMHNVKGLEYRAVALVGCDAQTLPLAAELERASHDQGDILDVLDMERNLLYVAGTRARDTLFISYVGQPSPFLDHLIKREQEELEQPKPQKLTIKAPQAPETLTHEVPTPPTPAPDEVPTPSQPITSFKISPSRIAQYFSFNCARNLRFSSAWSDTQRLLDHVPEAAPNSEYSKAILASGYAWEHKVISDLIPPHLLRLAPGKAAVTDRYFNPAQTLEVLRHAKPGELIYEPTLKAPPRFYQRYQIDQTRITLSNCRPDLVRVMDSPAGSPKSRMLRVIDLKRSAHIHSGYRIQVLLYALILDAIIEEHGIEDLMVDLSMGQIWLHHHDEPTDCDIALVRPHIEQFLRHELNDIFHIPTHEVPWHVHYKCEWCPYLEHCQTQMNTRDDLARVSGLSAPAKAHLHAHGIHDVHALGRLLDGPTEAADAILTTHSNLNSRRHLLNARVSALNTGKVIPQGAMAHGLTRHIPGEIRIFLTLQRESLGHSTYALATHLEFGPEVPTRVVCRHEHERTQILVAKNPAALHNIRRQFVVELYGILSRIDAFNLGQPSWQQQLSVQFFVYSGAEERLLTQLLFEAMQEPETARAAHTLLLYFQGPDLILADDHPGDLIALPVANLLNMLGQTLALPLPVAYTLPESVAALGLTLDYPRDPQIHFPLGPALRGDAIFEAWHSHAPEKTLELQQHIARYLEVISALFDKLRELAHDQLHNQIPRFSLPLAARIQSPLLSKLAFFVQYESAISCKQTRASRMIARHAIPYTNHVHELVALDDSNMQVLNPTPDARIEASTYTTWLIARDTPEGRRAQIRYNDYLNHSNFAGGGRPDADLAIAKITSVEVNDQDQPLAIRLSFTRKLTAPLEAGERFLLYPRFSDHLSDKLINVLERIEQTPEALFVKLLDDPAHIPSPHPLHPQAQANLDERRGDLSLTPSQLDALDHLCTQQILALWGPPGTGKTHFLASAILGLITAHERAGLPFRVLVTAFTHAAIGNLLRKLQELAAAQGLDLELAKISKDAPPEGISQVKDKKRLSTWHKKHSVGVIGGTIWAFEPWINTLDFDLVVVDEASQVKVPESAVPISLISSTGRIIFAGDHLQLPPIVQGTYPSQEEQEEQEQKTPIALHRSIFEAVLALDGGRFKRQLQENFRMNQTLTQISARLLYGPSYQCASPQIAQQRLPYTLDPTHTAFVQTCLVPEHPLVIGILHDLEPGKDNEPEAMLVGELVFALRQSLDPTTPFADDEDFFARGVFIVSPHHSQIRRIKRNLDTHPWSSPPFVDTVDKMQGQEASCVIVSYGVSDTEFAAQEAKFIYNLNRLNVAITRARQKTILLIPEALLNASPSVLDHDEAAQGLAYMRQLVALAETHATKSLFIRDGRTIEVLSLATLP